MTPREAALAYREATAAWAAAVCTGQPAEDVARSATLLRAAGDALADAVLASPPPSQPSPTPEQRALDRVNVLKESWFTSETGAYYARLLDYAARVTDD